MNWESILVNTLNAAIGPQAVIYALLAIGLNIHFGYSGLLNFGQAGFAAVGAYGIAMTVATWGLSFWLGVTFGLLAAVVFALVLGVPTLRLRADYLAIVTISAAEILRIVVKATDLEKWTGSTDGLQGFQTTFRDLNPYNGTRYGPSEVPLLGELPILRDTTWDPNTIWVLTVGWALVALMCLMVYLLMKSPWGRVLKGIREDEDAVRSLGKNVFSYKMQALVLGGVVGALGGFIFALNAGSVQPDNYGPEFTFYAYTALILGGAARVFGPVLGAMIFWLLLTFVGETLDSAVQEGVMPTAIMDQDQAGAARFILVGLGLMLLLVFRPQGIFGDKREIQLDAR